MGVNVEGFLNFAENFLHQEYHFLKHLFEKSCFSRMASVFIFRQWHGVDFLMIVFPSLPKQTNKTKLIVFNLGEKTGLKSKPNFGMNF